MRINKEENNLGNKIKSRSKSIYRDNWNNTSDYKCKTKQGIRKMIYNWKVCGV